MRIISQDGKYNMPYGLVVLERKDNKIYAYFYERMRVVAEYEDAETAQRAMEQAKMETADEEHHIINGIFTFPK